MEIERVEVDEAGQEVLFQSRVMVALGIPGAAGELSEAIPKDRDELAPRFDEATSREAGLAEHRGSVALTEAEWLAVQVERLTHLARGEHGKGHVALFVEGTSIPRISPLSERVESLEQRLTTTQPIA